MRCGFAYTSPYLLGRGLPSPRGGYPAASPLLIRLPTTGSGRALHRAGPEGPVQLQALSITGFGMGGSSPVREYQPVVHRLRLSASP
jgi:hypothetical protein